MYNIKEKGGGLLNNWFTTFIVIVLPTKHSSHVKSNSVLLFLSKARESALFQVLKCHVREFLDRDKYVYILISQNIGVSLLGNIIFEKEIIIF